jgi:hypothetical protein
MSSGLLELLGLTVTSTKMNKLSFPAMRTSPVLTTGSPSTLIRNGEALPPAKRIEETEMVRLDVLKILKRRVVEPTVVKTVSKTIVSCENNKLASGSSFSGSFRQEKSDKQRATTQEIRKMSLVMQVSKVMNSLEYEKIRSLLPDKSELSKKQGEGFVFQKTIFTFAVPNKSG